MGVGRRSDQVMKLAAVGYEGWPQGGFPVHFRFITANERNMWNTHPVRPPCRGDANGVNRGGSVRRQWQARRQTQRR